MIPLTDKVRRRLGRFIHDTIPEPTATFVPASIPRRDGGEPLPRTVRTDRAWKDATDRWLELDRRVKEAEEMRSKAADVLTDLHPTDSAVGNGVELIRMWRIGSLNLQRLTKGLGIAMEALDIFRNPRKLVTTVRRMRGTPSSGTRPDVGVPKDSVWTIRAEEYEKEE